MSTLIIRLENAEEIDAIRAVLTAAFDQPTESDLVEALRLQKALTYSFVLVQEQEVIGHIAFSPVSLNQQETLGLALAPVSILPLYQQHGLGSLLIQHTLSYLERETHYAFVVVVGAPDYYQRFGFVPAHFYQLSGNIIVPDDYLMIKVFDASKMMEGGVIEYHPVFRCCPD